MPSRDRSIALFVLALLIASGAVFTYWRVMVEDRPGDYHVRKGNYRLEDGQWEEAIDEFEAALAANPRHAGARLGLGIVHMQSGRLERAIAVFDELLAQHPTDAAGYANRGIAHDRSGRHEDALRDYQRALELEPKLAKGPGWLWRFLRNVQEKPPTIRDRADYLAAELAKPPEQRVLQVPQEDGKQRMYKVQ